MIRVDPRDEGDLRWYSDGEYEGEMGRRSNQGGIQDALERGAVSRMGPNGFGAQAEGGLRAARRLHVIEQKMRRCPAEEQRVLVAAFLTRDLRGGLNAFGSFPGAVWGSQRAFAALQSEGLVPFDRIRARLAGLVSRMNGGHSKDREVAAAIVVQTRQAAEEDLIGALTRYGARFRTDAAAVLPGDVTSVVGGTLLDGDGVGGLVVPREVTLTKLAVAVASDKRTVAAQLAELGIVPPEQRRNGQAWLISVAQLQNLWPAAVSALVR
jgi:hypothetical protein